MKRSITIVPFVRYSKVSFYSLQYEDEEENEEGELETITDKFFKEFLEKPEYTESLGKLHDWIELIGDEYGATAGLFRFEDKAEALPPHEKNMKAHGIVLEDPLRLYLYRVSDSIVILMTGGVKDFYDKSVRDCPNLLPRFRFANSMTHQIKEAISCGLLTFKGQELNLSDHFYLS